MKYINTPELLKMIRANMIKDDIKIKDLATLMDKSQSAASSIMRQENISLDSLKEICDALNYDLDIEIKKRQQDLSLLPLIRKRQNIHPAA